MWEIVETGRISGVGGEGGGVRIDWNMGREGPRGSRRRQISAAEMEEPTRSMRCEDRLV